MLKSLVEQYDRTEKGALNFGEVITLIAEEAGDASSTPQKELLLWASIFAELDEAGSGWLSSTQVQTGLLGGL